MTAAELSRRYIDAHNAHDLEALVALVADEIDFKRPDDPVLTSWTQVRERYATDYSNHGQAHVSLLRLLVAGSTVIAEIEVDAGPPSNEWYRGVVIHDWDMASFADQVLDARARDDLQVAVDGKSAFRRFQAALDRHEANRVDWRVWSSERRMGRAREWLADEGYDPIP